MGCHTSKLTMSATYTAPKASATRSPTCLDDKRTPILPHGQPRGRANTSLPINACSINSERIFSTEEQNDKVRDAKQLWDLLHEERHYLSQAESKHLSWKKRREARRQFENISERLDAISPEAFESLNQLLNAVVIENDPELLAQICTTRASLAE